MSLADTFTQLNTPADTRKLILGEGWLSGADTSVWADSSNRSNAASNEARAAEEKFKDLVTLYNQRCQERDTLRQQLEGSQALEEPANVGQRLGQVEAYSRIIADLPEVIEQHRATAMNAKIRAERFKALDSLVGAVIRKHAPGPELAAIFGVNDSLDLAPPLLRSTIQTERAKALAAERQRQADAERLAEIARQRADEEAARLEAAREKMDETPLEEIAALFFKGEALRLVLSAIAGGYDQEASSGRLHLAAHAKQDPLTLGLSPEREYALDRLLRKCGLSSVQEYADQRLAQAASQPKAEPLTVEKVAEMDDWRALLDVSGVEQKDVMSYYFLNGCDGGQGDYLLQRAVETVKGRPPLNQAAILRLNQVAQAIRMQRTQRPVGV
jgi:hypothetical protein